MCYLVNKCYILSSSKFPSLASFPTHCHRKVGRNLDLVPVVLTRASRCRLWHWAGGGGCSKVVPSGTLHSSIGEQSIIGDHRSVLKMVAAVVLFLNVLTFFHQVASKHSTFPHIFVANYFVGEVRCECHRLSNAPEQHWHLKTDPSR